MIDCIVIGVDKTLGVVEGYCMSLHFGTAADDGIVVAGLSFAMLDFVVVAVVAAVVAAVVVVADGQ